MIKFFVNTAVFFLLVAFSQAQEYDPDLLGKAALFDRLNFQRKLNFQENDAYAFCDLVYQRLELKINPERRYIKGVVTSHVEALHEGLHKIVFDLHNDLTVDSVLSNRQKTPFVHAKNQLAISLKNQVEIGQLDSVQIFYHGEPPTDTEGFGAFEKSQHSGVPIIWTLSEPYGALEWFPCKQSLADKIDSIDVIVTSPDSFRTASNGILVSETVENGTRRMHWKHRFPIATYLVAVAVTNYANYSDTLFLADGRQIEILNFVYPENLQKAKMETPVTLKIMELFNRLIGEYPFAREKYGHAQFGWNGGMEHQTMSFMGNFGFGLIAHELAHQWFGNHITLGSWQDVWLNEGFATYLTGLAYENLLEGVWWPVWKRTTLNHVISQPGGSVFVQDTSSVGNLFNSRLSYSKGAYLLHQLRWILGDEDFFSGMQCYFNDPQTSGGFARSKQFIAHMEAAGDTSLGEYFSDWLYGEGFPIYSAEFSTSGTDTVKITLSQSPSIASVGFFKLPVPVRVYSANKTDSADFKLVHTTNQQSFFRTVNFPVAELKIDPDRWLISHTNSVVKAGEPPAVPAISAYPNPFSDMLTLLVPLGQQVVSARLYNIRGQFIRELSAGKVHVDLSDLPGGSYILSVETAHGRKELKLVKR